MIDPLLFLQQTINFLVLLFLLHRLLYKPVRKFLDERTTSIEEQINSANDLRQQAEQIRTQLEAEQEQTRSQAREHIEQAIRRGEQLHEEMIAKAKEEAEQIRARMQEDMVQEKEKAWTDLKNDVIQLSFTIASKVVQENLDQQKQERLITQIIDGLDDRNLGERL